jgi:hypothetical protein
MIHGMMMASRMTVQSHIRFNPPQRDARFASASLGRNPISRPELLCMAHISPPRPPMMPPVTIAGTRTEGPERAPDIHPTGSDAAVSAAQSR